MLLPLTKSTARLGSCYPSHHYYYHYYNRSHHHTFLSFLQLYHDHYHYHHATPSSSSSSSSPSSSSFSLNKILQQPHHHLYHHRKFLATSSSRFIHSSSSSTSTSLPPPPAVDIKNPVSSPSLLPPPPPSQESQPKPIIVDLSPVMNITKLVADGSVKYAAKKYSKAELADRFKLELRDLRNFDVFNRFQTGEILVRPHVGVIVVNILGIHALIKHDALIIYDPLNVFPADDASVSEESKTSLAFLQEYLHKKEGQLPFELRALEGLLQLVIIALKKRADSLFSTMEAALKDMRKTPNKNSLTAVLEHSNQVQRFKVAVEALRGTLAEILKSDDDLAGLFLTHRVSTGEPRPRSDHDEAEYMLEAYHRFADTLLTQIDQLLATKQYSQDVVKISLDAQRNEYMVFELQVAVSVLGVSTSAMVFSAFGMNFSNGLEMLFSSSGGSTTTSALEAATTTAANTVASIYPVSTPAFWIVVVAAAVMGTLTTVRAVARMRSVAVRNATSFVEDSATRWRRSHPSASGAGAGAVVGSGVGITPSSFCGNGKKVKSL